MTTLTLYRYPKSQIFWAFTQMQLAHNKLAKTPGLKFYKLMGSGSAGGVGLWPNWRVYAFLGIWDSIADFKNFQLEQSFAKEIS